MTDTIALQGTTEPEGTTMTDHHDRDPFSVAVDEPDRTALLRLLEPFPPDAVSRLPRSSCRACSDSPRRRCDQHQWVSNCPECGGRHSSATIHLDYVGHADVTRRLLEVDPAWSWEPVAWDGNGLPIRDQDGGMWIRLTVLGVSRLGYGDAQGKRGPNGTKELIGDALRNAAMRFGVAVDLWSKSDAAEARKAAGGSQDDTPGDGDEPDGATLEHLLGEVLAEALPAIGDRTVLLPLYQKATGTPGLADMPMPADSEHAGRTLGEFIVWAGQQAPVSAGEPAGGTEAEESAVRDCEGASRDGRPCVKPAGHTGNHRYGDDTTDTEETK